MVKKILLHSCCAVCMGYPVEKLKTMGYLPIIYFYNPNIYPKDEYLRRRDELIKYCQKCGYEYLIEEGSHDDWLDYIKGLEKEPEKGSRCDKCFEYRLKKSAHTAKELGVDYLATTLTVSPHKQSENIFVAGVKATESTDVILLKENFKKENGFLKTMQIAKENDFYRQQYCGCEFSIRK